MPEPLVETGFNSYDGVLVDLQFVAFGSGQLEFEVTTFTLTELNS